MAGHIFEFTKVPIKASMSLFKDMEDMILRFIWKHGRLQVDKAVLREKNLAGENGILELKLYYRAIVTKPDVTQWNRINEPEINATELQWPESQQRYPKYALYLS